MPFDPGLVERIRDALARLGERGMRERGIFSGRGFLEGKRTFVIAWDDSIIAKMPPEEYEGALQRAGVIAFAPDGERPMSTWVVVSADVVADDPEMAEWVALALRGVRSAPPPTAKTRKPDAKTKGGASARGTTAAASGRKSATSRGKPTSRARVTKKAKPRTKHR